MKPRSDRLSRELCEYRRLINEIVDIQVRDVPPERDPRVEPSPRPPEHTGHEYPGDDSLSSCWSTERGAHGSLSACTSDTSTPMHVATFRRVFRCSLEFESSFDGISFASRCLDYPNEFADPGLAVHARRLLDLVPGIRKQETLTERVRSTIPFLISNGQADVQGVAQYLGIPVRTFQRRLAAEGQPFGNSPERSAARAGSPLPRQLQSIDHDGRSTNRLFGAELVHSLVHRGIRSPRESGAGQLWPGTPVTLSREPLTCRRLGLGRANSSRKSRRNAHCLCASPSKAWSPLARAS